MKGCLVGISSCRQFHGLPWFPLLAARGSLFVWLAPSTSMLQCVAATKSIQTVIVSVVGAVCCTRGSGVADVFLCRCLQVPVAPAAAAWPVELPAQQGGCPVQLLQELGVRPGVCVPSVCGW